MEMVCRATGKMVLAGLLAGAAGGVAGSVAKIVSEAMYPPRTLGQVPPPLLLAERWVGHPLEGGGATAAIQVIHFVFGTGVGAIYGGVAEVAPMVTAGYGVVFGLVLQIFTHESAVPAMGLDVPASQQPMREHVSEFISHACYGLATELVRRRMRRRLTPAPVPVEV